MTTTKRMVKMKGWAILSKFGFWRAHPYIDRSKASVDVAEVNKAGNEGSMIPCTISYQLPTPKKK